MIYALVDCNAFFCSCERVFRPDLWNRPIAVLSNNDGCFVSCTRDVKELGIKIGEPYFKYKQLCDEKGIVLFSSNFALYTDMSDRVMSILSRFTPDLEVYSVDEAFLDLSGFVNRSLNKYVEEIQNTVFKLTGIPVSVGVAKTKTLAKIAAGLAKREITSGGVKMLLDGDVVNKSLSKIKVEDIWGIGKSSGLKLKTLQIRSAKELIDYKNDSAIQRVLGKNGLTIKDELSGICSIKERDCSIKKSIQSSRSFAGTVSDLRLMRETISKHISTACERARAQGSVIGSAEIFFGTTPFSSEDSRQQFVHETVSFNLSTDTRKIIKYSLSVVDEWFRDGLKYKKAGITLGKLSDNKNIQLGLFEKSDSPKSEKLMSVMDKINAKDGEGTLRFASCGTADREIRSFKEFRSPKYQSSWKELPKVF